MIKAQTMPQARYIEAWLVFIRLLSRNQGRLSATNKVNEDKSWSVYRKCKIIQKKVVKSNLSTE